MESAGADYTVIQVTIDLRQPYVPHEFGIGELWVEEHINRLSLRSKKASKPSLHGCSYEALAPTTGIGSRPDPV